MTEPASRDCFDLDVPSHDQVRTFSRFAGDESPLHMEPAFARRTRFRRCIVPGIQLVLAAVEKVFNQEIRIRRLIAKFISPVPVGEGTLRIEAVRESGRLNMVAHWRERTAFTATVEFVPDDKPRKPLVGGRNSSIDLVNETTPSAFEGASGKIRRALDPELFAAAIGGSGNVHPAEALALALASTVVGMRAPGRFASLVSIDLVPVIGTAPGAAVAYRVDRWSTATRMLSVALDATGKTSGVRGRATSLLLQPLREVQEMVSNVRGGILGGHRAFIAGGSGGLGKAIAWLFAHEGASVGVAYNQGKTEASKLVKEIRAGGGKAEAISLDVRDRDSCQKAVERAGAAFGGLDIVVHCAVPDANAKSFYETSADDFYEQFGVAVLGVRNLVFAALPYLLETRGVVVGLSSSIVERPQPRFSAYMAAKGAMEALFRGLAVEFAPQGVRFNLVCPGFVLTDLNAAASDSDIRRITTETPVGRLATPEDIAKMALVAASDLSGFSTGQRFFVNGGLPPFA